MKKVNWVRRFSAGVFVVALFGLAMVLPTHANNIQVGTPTLTDQNTTDDYTHVQFNLDWDNSWRTSSAPNNYDAAWVFVKYKVTSSNWAHATLNTSGHSVTTNNGVAATITTSSDGKGVFLYRTNDATGSINWDGVKLRWNYGTDGVADNDTVTVKVFAIEMVYVPTGTFAAGSGGSESTKFTLTTINTGSATTAPTGTGGFSGSKQGGYPDGQTAPANDSWPNGYNAFYCMKHEISQGQYADFLNTLTTTQDSSRFPNNNGNLRHTISGSSGSHSASRPDRACNYLSWPDGAAYSDWAGLRPMTELEFEKACRGTIAPVANEYAWGATTIVADASLTISGTEDGTETITTDVSDGACIYDNNTHSGGDGGQGPLRVGIFAKSSTTRTTSGASYYGIMEMSGNLWERSVTIGNSDGRNFTGTHGDGALDSNGDANVSNWPGTNASGAGFRGGFWGNVAAFLRVSDRFNAADTFANRFDDIGFRCVRWAP